MSLCSKIPFYSHLDAQCTNSNSLTFPCLHTICVSHVLVKVLDGNGSSEALNNGQKDISRADTFGKCLMLTTENDKSKENSIS